MKKTEYKPDYKTIENLGDINPLDHGGLFLNVDANGKQCATLVNFESLGEDEYGDATKWRHHEIVLTPCTFIGGVLSDNEFHPDSEVWFASRLKEVAGFADTSKKKLIAALCGDCERARAMAYSDLASFYGWHEFDNYPIDIDDRAEAEKFLTLFEVKE